MPYLRDYVQTSPSLIQLFDTHRYDAFCRLLALPDPPGLPRRGCRPLVLPGKADRFETWIPRVLRAQRERLIAGRAALEQQAA